MTDTTPRKRATVIVYANLPNLTKKMLHKSLEMSRAIVCWVIKQFNATRPVTSPPKKIWKKKFPFLGFRKRVPFPRKTSFAFPQNSRFIPREGKLFSATFSFSLGVTGPVTLNCLITQQTVALLISGDLCNIFLVKFGMFA